MQMAKAPFSGLSMQPLSVELLLEQTGVVLNPFMVQAPGGCSEHPSLARCCNRGLMNCCILLLLGLS